MARNWEGDHRNKATGEHVAYRDIGGVWTACYGQTGARVAPGGRYSQTTCDQWLRDELLDTHNAVMRCLQQPEGLTPSRQAAFVVMAYNVGVSGFCSSAAAGFARRSDWPSACRAIQVNNGGRPAWSYVNGRFVQGLANRRGAERELCEGRAAP
ncbi:MAG TPA: lysozyme [Chitinolyticbacter sp.]|nr:lysozyme [Chitinolyticbacter sp.]